MKITWCGPENVCFTADTEEQAYKQAIAYWWNAGYVLEHHKGDAYMKDLKHSMDIAINLEKYGYYGKNLENSGCAYLVKLETVNV